jgi:hypothetical protein
MLLPGGLGICVAVEIIPHDQFGISAPASRQLRSTWMAVIPNADSGANG